MVKGKFVNKRQLRESWRRSPIFSKGKSLIFAVLFVLSMTFPVVAQVTAPNALQLVEKAGEYYQQRQYNQAVENLAAAAENFAASGDKINQAMALSNLSLTYQEMGEWEKANQTIATSINLLGNQEKNEETLRILAQSLDIQGKINLDGGQAEIALENWEKAAAIYPEIAAKDLLAKNKINQAQALQNLGLYPRACQKILTVLELERQQCELTDAEIENLFQQRLSPTKITALVSLGKILGATGSLQQSEEILNQTKELLTGEEGSLALITLGNIERSLAIRNQELFGITEEADLKIQYIENAKEYTEKALNNYETAATKTSSNQEKSQAKINQFNLLIENSRWEEAEKLLPQIEELLTTLPKNRASIYAEVNYARNLVCLEEKQPKCLTEKGTINNISPAATEILIKAAQTGKEIQDQRGESIALGNLGLLSEYNEDIEAGKQYTESALKLSREINADDLTYQWYWQLGRVIKSEDRITAIAYYNQAYNVLNSLRSDLVALNPELQFSFRENVEPVYREYVDLLLTENPTQENLKEARSVIETLQLAELDNFFRDSCLQAKPINIDELDPTAAIFYPIILPERLEVIVAIPGQPLKNYQTQLSQEEVETSLEEVRTALATKAENINPLLQVWYEKLIAPIETELVNNNIKTLIFIPDGALRNIPIAALYNGNQYIVEKYKVAIAPSLQLVDPQSLTRQQLKVLAGGVSQPRQGFPPLPYVEPELETIKTEINSEVLINENFTETTLNTAINASPYQVVHLATHGKFSSLAAETFVLTWDERIDINELDNLLRTEEEQKKIPIELLVLSACQTAVGDKQAALGLAGVAVRAGARSTLASLWYVSDKATQLLMTRFYEELANSNISKAEALQRSQQTVLATEEFSHPYFWSAFILVGNWL